MSTSSFGSDQSRCRSRTNHLYCRYDVHPTAQGVSITISSPPFQLGAYGSAYGILGRQAQNMLFFKDACPSIA